MTVYWIYADLNDIRIHRLSKALDAICAPMAFQGEFSHPLQFVRIKTLHPRQMCYAGPAISILMCVHVIETINIWIR